MTYRQKRERPENWKEYKTRTHRVWAPPILAVKWLEECWQGNPKPLRNHTAANRAAGRKLEAFLLTIRRAGKQENIRPGRSIFS
jgi:hypothetical protein